MSSISKLKFKKKQLKTLLKTIFKQVFPSLSSTWLQLFIAGGDAHGQIQTLCVRNRYRDQLNTGIPRPTPSVRLLYLSVESVQRAALYQRSANHSQHRSSTVRQRESRQHQCTLFKLFFFYFLQSITTRISSLNSIYVLCFKLAYSVFVFIYYRLVT